MPLTAIPGFAEPVSSLSHLIGAVVFLGLSYFLVRRGRGDGLRVASLVVFSVGSVFLLSISGVYHLLDPSGPARHVMHVLDHAAIFVLIACSFTPIHIILFHGWGRWGVLALVWGYAIAAITLKTIYFASMPTEIGLALYLGMGWIGAYPGVSIWRRFGFHFMEPLLWGGLAYSIGAVLEFVHWPVIFPGVVQWHEVFHVAVLIGLAFHWSFIYSIADGRFSPGVECPVDLAEACPQPARSIMRQASENDWIVGTFLNCAHMKPPFRRAVLLALLTAAPAFAEGIVDYVPGDAAAVAIVHNLETIDGKFQQIAQVLAAVIEKMPAPPVAMVKAATGGAPGLDERGDALLALLPGDTDGSPKPMVLLAVSDYARFAEAIRGDPTGEICRVAIAGQDVLVAQRGDYAMFMNLEHRPTMEALLTAVPQPPTVLADLGPWFAEHDFAVVALPGGLEQYALRRLAQVDAAPVAYWQPALQRALFRYLGAEVHAAAIGVSVDNAANVRASSRIVFTHGDAAAALARTKASNDSPLVGYPDELMILASGGPLPLGWGDGVAKLLRDLIERNPELYGFQAFAGDHWPKVETSWRSMLTVDACSAVWMTGKKDDPLIGNMYFRLTVDDAQAYLNRVRESFEIWNELTKKSTNDIRLLYDINPGALAIAPSLAISADVAGAAGDEEFPLMKAMWDASLGKSGRLQSYWIAAGDHTVIVSVGDPAQATKAAQWNAAKERGLAQSAHAKAASDMLDPAAPWKLFVSPQGCVAWYERLYALLTAHFGAEPLTIPAYPAGPPLGASVNVVGEQLQIEVVAPAQALRDMADYIKPWMR